MKEQKVKIIQLYQNNNNRDNTTHLLSAKCRVQIPQAWYRKSERTGSISDAPRLGRPVSATSLVKPNEIKESLISTPPPNPVDVWLQIWA